MKKCKCCGNDILENLSKCPYCGSKQEVSSGSGADGKENSSKEKEILLNEKIQNLGKNIEKAKESDWFSKFRTPEGTLKLYGIIAGTVYIYFVCSCLQYLGYYSSWYKIWGSVMIAICILNAGIYFSFFFKSKCWSNKRIFYVLIGGTVIKCILHIVQVQWSSRYEYWDVSAGEYLPAVWTVIIAIIGLLLLKNAEKKETEEMQEK